MTLFYGGARNLLLAAFAFTAVVSAQDYTQIQTESLAAKDYAKVIDAGVKGLEKDPDNLGYAYNNLKASEGLKDAAGIQKWAAESSRIARKVAQNAKDDEEGKRMTDYARQTDIYTEYSLSVGAAQSTNPAETIALFDTLEKQNPKSQYIGQSSGMYLRALQKTGKASEMGPSAERILVNCPDCDEALLIAADYNLNQKQNAKVVEQSSKLIDVLNSQQKPEGMTDADWTSQKNKKLGLAYWYNGLAYSGQGKFADADKALRNAVPLLAGNDQLLGVGLFNLGLADYNMAKASKNKALLQDALKFSQQSAAIKGPLQGQAAANVKVIRAELGIKGK